MYTQIGQIGSYMIIQSVKGDLIKAFKNGMVDILIHGCNCFNNHGKGIALSIKNQYPEASIVDSRTIKGDKNKLGNYTVAKTENGSIINAYTQYNYGYGKRNADYDAIRNVFLNLNNAYKDQGLIFGIPSVGAGLAGGDWKQIEKIINESTPDINIIHFYL